jgi:hypothetical protein
LRSKCDHLNMGGSVTITYTNTCVTMIDRTQCCDMECWGNMAVVYPLHLKGDASLGYTLMDQETSLTGQCWLLLIQGDTHHVYLRTTCCSCRTAPQSAPACRRSPLLRTSVQVGLVPCQVYTIFAAILSWLVHQHSRPFGLRLGSSKMQSPCLTISSQFCCGGGGGGSGGGGITLVSSVSVSAVGGEGKTSLGFCFMIVEG